MIINRVFSLLLSICLMIVMGCSGNSGSGQSSASGNAMGAMTVRLVDSPTSAFQAINLDIQQVQIHASAAASESGWITLGSPNKVVNLLALQGGVVETLAAGASLSAGTYQQLRLVLGSRNGVVLGDGTTADLKVPSGMQTGVKIPGSFTVLAGTTADIFIDFDAAHSIHIHEAGPSRSYILRPVVQGFDKAVTGSISGTLTGTGGAALVGVDVYAERIDAGGSASIVRSVKTQTGGAYTLDLLPLGGSYFVVSLPTAGGVTYQAQASGALALSTSQPTRQYSASFTPAIATGGLAGTISPPATSAQLDSLLVLQAFPNGSGGQWWLAVASLNVVGATPETYLVADLPVGLYTAVVVRSTLNADGTTTVARSNVGAAVQVTAAVSAALNVTF